MSGGYRKNRCHGPSTWYSALRPTGSGHAFHAGAAVAASLFPCRRACIAPVALNRRSQGSGYLSRARRAGNPG